MKKRPTKQVEILVHGEKNQKFVGPRAGLDLLLRLLNQYEFYPVKNQSQDSLPWEELASERIEKYSKPGLALRGARLKEGLSQIKLAGKLGIPQYNLSKMENGKRPIGKKMAQRLSKFLNIDYQVFL